MKVSVEKVMHVIQLTAVCSAVFVCLSGNAQAKNYTGAAVQIPATMVQGVGVERQASLCEMGYRRALRGDTPEQVTRDLKHMPRTELNAVAWCYNQGVKK